MILIIIAAVVVYFIFSGLAKRKGYDHKKSSWGASGAGIFVGVTFGVQLLASFAIGASGGATDIGSILLVSILAYIPGIIAAAVLYQRYKSKPYYGDDNDLDSFGQKRDESDFE